MIKKKLLKEIPEKCGVYYFKDKTGQIIYIGKSVNLKSRVSSYFNGNSHKSGMENHIAEIDYIICKSDIFALLLEDLSIKTFKPHFNIRLRRYSSSMKLSLTKDEFPALVIEDIESNSDNETLMILPSKYYAQDFIQKASLIFKLRTCTGKNPDGQCIQYTFGRCHAPCRKLITPDKYNDEVEKFREFIKGNCRSEILRLQKEMRGFADRMEFEDAIETKEKISFLERQSARYGLFSDFSNSTIKFTDNKYEYWFSNQNLVAIRSAKRKNRAAVDFDKIKTKKDKVMLEFRRKFKEFSYANFNNNKQYYLFDRFNVIYPYLKKDKKTSKDKSEMIIR